MRYNAVWPATRQTQNLVDKVEERRIKENITKGELTRQALELYVELCNMKEADEEKL